MIINKDGKYPIKFGVVGAEASTAILYLSGDSGGGTLTLQYKDELDTWQDLTNGVLDINTENTLDMGVGMNIVLDVSGSTAPSISLIVKVAG